MKFDYQPDTSKEDLMLAQKVWAVIGANQNPRKFGNKIYRKLKNNNYKVFAVNPFYQTVDDDPCYASLTDLPEKPAVLDMVVSPAKGIPFIKEAAALGIQYIWLQPGTYDDSVMSLIDELGLTAVQACVLVAIR